MSNYIPYETKRVCPQEPNWLNRKVKNLLRKQNKIYRKFKRNGYKIEDKLILDILRNESSEAIKNAKEDYMRSLGVKLADSTTGQKNIFENFE